MCNSTTDQCTDTASCPFATGPARQMAFVPWWDVDAQRMQSFAVYNDCDFFKAKRQPFAGPEPPRTIPEGHSTDPRFCPFADKFGHNSDNCAESARGRSLQNTLRTLGYFPLFWDMPSRTKSYEIRAWQYLGTDISRPSYIPERRVTPLPGLGMTIPVPTSSSGEPEDGGRTAIQTPAIVPEVANAGVATTLRVPTLEVLDKSRDAEEGPSSRKCLRCCGRTYWLEKPTGW